jgi:hypothetical protein
VSGVCGHIGVALLLQPKPVHGRRADHDTGGGFSSANEPCRFRNLDSSVPMM